MKKRTIIVVSLFITLSFVAVLLAATVAIKTKKENPESWILHSYGNNVALYNGNEIVEVYGSIVLDTLPEEDKKLLDNGIHFTTRDEAVTAIEDYDG